MNCASCGADDQQLATVHRVYLTPGSSSDTSLERILDDTEYWCVACRTQYPHEPIGP
jgi:hypothetical protein